MNLSASVKPLALIDLDFRTALLFKTVTEERVAKELSLLGLMSSSTRLPDTIHMSKKVAVIAAVL